MTGIATHGVFAPGLSTLGSASSVVEECLRAQLKARPRGLIARFFGLTPLRSEAREWYRQALCEMRSVPVFSRLGSEFTVLQAAPHSAAAPGAAALGADHLVVGPSGLFVVTTMSFLAKRVRVGGARFMVNGRVNGCVADSQRAAAGASREFSDIAGAHIDVTPLIVVVEPRSLSLSEPHVAVTESSRVAKWFADLPRILSSDTVHYLSTIAELPGSWQPIATSDDAERHARRFDRLRREVEAARHRSRSWLFAALSVLVGSAVAAFSEPLLALVGLS